MAGWIEWCGGDCPVRADQLVCVKYRDGMIIKGFAFPKAFVWEHTGCARDIVAYFLAIDGAEAQQRAHSTAAAACKDFCAECAVDGCCEDCCHCSTRQDGAREGEAVHQWRITRGPMSQLWHDGPLPEFALESERALFEFETRTLYTTPPAPDEAVEAEREACAKLAENYGPSRPLAGGGTAYRQIYGRWEGEQAASTGIAHLIRARSRRRGAI
ncbi:hypothetical protein [Labrys neptuniae]